MTLLSGCGSDLASLIDPTISSLPVDNPLLETTGSGMQPVTNVQYIGGAPEAQNVRTQQSQPETFNAEAAQAFADGLKDGVSANPCDWTFNNTTAVFFATHCGALAQNMEISDIKENDRRTLSFWETVYSAKTDIDVGSTVTLTFESGVTAPDEIDLVWVSLAASVRHGDESETAQIYLTSFPDKVLETPIENDDGSFDYTIRGGLSGETLINRVLEVEFTGVTNALDVLRLAPEPNTIDVAVLLSLYDPRNPDLSSSIRPHQITDVDFTVRLADQMTLSTGD